MSERGREALASFQREFGSWISAVEGEPDAARLERRVRADRGVPAARRIDVYAHAYFARLHEALGEDFPALAAALGDDAFHDLAKLYLLAHPPASFTLRVLGAQLPDFLASPAAAWFRERWPFAPDLAALEWAIADVFDAEDRPLLAREALAAVPPESWGELVFGLVPAQRVLALAWPAERLRAAHDAGEPLPALAPARTRVLVWRRHERVRTRALDDDEGEALAAIAAGEDFASVCARFASAEAVLARLERWLADGLLSAR